ncbi:MAG TPA: metallophosphoesterase, partial [Syntrophorhabdaceae bacterium]|nr:metallophosphoesterase [Syntrophorhabdaceae bacterium]
METRRTEPSILHFADFHIEDDSWVLKHLEKAANRILSVVDEIKPSLIVIAGDYFEKSLHFDGPGARFAVDFLKKLSGCAPVLMEEGTETHDRESLETLARMLPDTVTIVREPSVVSFPYIPELADCDFYCMPGIKKKNFKKVAETYGLDLLKTQPGDLAAYQFQKWAEEKVHREGRDAIFVGHIQLGIDGLDKMKTGYEPAISPETINFIKPSLGLLGHVHDLISYGNLHYSGNIVPRSMTEAESVIVGDDGSVRYTRRPQKKGFYVHTRQPDGSWENTLHEIETARFCEISIHARDEEDLAVKMQAARDHLKQISTGMDEDGIICKFNIETPDQAVSEALFRHENTVRDEIGGVVDIVSPSINVTSFSDHAARVENIPEWQKKSA